MHIHYPHFLRRHVQILCMSIVALAGSFTVGVQTVGEVTPIRLIEAGSTEIRGDLDGSGVVDIQDVTIILEIANGYRSALPEELKRDPNGDGRLTVDDALMIIEDLSVL